MKIAILESNPKSFGTTWKQDLKEFPDFRVSALSFSSIRLLKGRNMFFDFITKNE
jgi:hypothetical protein